MTQIILMGICCICFICLQSFIFRKFWEKNLSVSVKFDQTSLVKGETGYLTEEVINAKRLPIPILIVKFQTSKELLFQQTKGAITTDYFYRNDIFQINRYEKIIRKHSFIAGKRGYYTIRKAELTSSDWLIRKTLYSNIELDTQLYIYPDFFPMDEIQKNICQLYGDIVTKRNIVEDPFEIRGIRPYQPYDNMKAVNWKATAKTGSLMVNQNNYTAMSEVRIFVNSEDKGILKREESVEAALSITATISRFFLKQGMKVSCFCNGLDVLNKTPLRIPSASGTCQLDNILKALARIDTSQKNKDFTAEFQEELLNNNKDVLTIFISPNNYNDFEEVLLKYSQSHQAFWWFYPLSDKEEPDIPKSLASKVQFIHLHDRT